MHVMLFDDVSSIDRELKSCMCGFAICALLLLTDSLCADSVHSLLSFHHCNIHGFVIVASHMYTTYINALCAYGSRDEMRHHEALQKNAACHFVCMCQSTFTELSTHCL